VAILPPTNNIYIYIYIISYIETCIYIGYTRKCGGEMAGVSVEAVGASGAARPGGSGGGGGATQGGANERGGCDLGRCSIGATPPRHSASSSPSNKSCFCVKKACSSICQAEPPLRIRVPRARLLRLWS